MGPGAANPRPAHPRRPAEPDHFPGRHRVRQRGAATAPLRDLPLGVRPAGPGPGDDRGDAPRLADVPPADQPLRLRRQAGGGEAARAPRLREQAPAGGLQRPGAELAGLLHLHRLRGPGRQVPTHHAELLGLRPAGQLDDPHAEGRVLPPGHRAGRPAAGPPGREGPCGHRAEVHQQVDPGRVRSLRGGPLLVGPLVLRLGVEGPLRRARRPGRGGQGQPE